MMPADVGAAAAYEVWRNWKYHYGIYGQPLAGDMERQREALVGLAVGEGISTITYNLIILCHSKQIFIFFFSIATLAIHRAPRRRVWTYGGL